MSAPKNILEWARAAVVLYVIADETAKDAGWFSEGTNETQISWFARAVASFSGTASTPEFQGQAEDGVKAVSRINSIASILVDRNVVCVQPKSRTPMVGAGLRTLSHNLALLPAQGEVSVCWTRIPEKWAPATASLKTDKLLNILLVPFPFEMRADWFAPKIKNIASVIDKTDRTKGVAWGWFELKQDWLKPGPPQITNFVRSLIAQARKKTKNIHGIIFPEYALNWTTFDHLAKAIKLDSDEYENLVALNQASDVKANSLHGVEFLVSGSQNNCEKEDGNFVLVSQFYQIPAGSDESSTSNPSKYGWATWSRPKHHRWILDQSQVQAYGLQDVLDPNIRWSEKMRIRPREIHAHVFRNGSFFVPMICEDLARSDPCHDVLRAIGPNLAFVLLMDGPQLKDRWAARYAQTLSDDPGTAVLTFTSLGLIERMNGSGAYPRSRSVGLFRDARGQTREIICPEGDHGVVISLRGEETKETTLDGRENIEGFGWFFERYQPVRVTPGEERTKIMELP